MFNFIVTVDGGVDSAAGQLVVVDALDLSLTPGVQIAEAGQARNYTLTVSNLLPTQEEVGLKQLGFLT